MKVELLRTLKGHTETWPAGEVFVEPFPEEIISEIALNRGVVRVIEAPAPPPMKEPEEDETEGLDLDAELAAIEEVAEGEPPPKIKPRKKAAPKKAAPAKKKAAPKKKTKLEVPK